MTYIKKLSLHLDPLIFPIMFPHGDLGWNPSFKQNLDASKKLSPLQYYSYRLAFRPKKKFSPFFFSGD